MATNSEQEQYEQQATVERKAYCRCCGKECLVGMKFCQQCPDYDNDHCAAYISEHPEYATRDWISPNRNQQ